MKKTVLTLLILLSLPLKIIAENVMIDGIAYNLNSNSLTAEVVKNQSGFSNYSGKIVIPNKVKYKNTEYTVTSIGAMAFYNCNALTSLSLPNSITRIEDLAFAHCSKIPLLSIPAGVIYIGTYAFSECNVSNLLLHCETVGEDWFWGCNMVKIELGDEVKYIKKSAFYDCVKLNVLEGGNNVIEIGESAFHNCKSLTSIKFPNAEIIDKNSFYGCENMSSVLLNSIITIGESAFSQCSKINTLELGNKLKTIGDASFYYCTSIKSVKLPNSIESIGYSAFGECESIKSLELGKNLIEIGSVAFTHCSITSLTIPDKVISIGSGAFANCALLRSVRIGKSIKEILRGAFNRCYDLKEVLCSAKQVPNTSETAFSNINTEDITLYVPSESINLYKASKPWSDFKDIIGKDDFISDSFTIIYYIDNVEYKTIIVDYGDAITPEATPSKEGYSFSGWGDIPSIMPDHDVYLYGYYIINKHKISYLVDGKEYKSYEMEYNSDITPEEPPTKEGYTFSGWSKIPSKMPDHDVTVTGSFVANKYKITYMLDGEVYKVVEYEYGKKVTPATRPTGNYATFEWENLPSTMPAHDVVVNAKYTLKENEPEPEVKSHRMVLSFKNGDNVAFILKEKPQISFSGDKFVVESSTGTIEYLRSDIEDFHFDEVATGMESIEYSGKGDVVIYDMNGRMVARLRNETIDSAKMYLNEFKPGMYILKVGNQKTIKYLKK